jgi:hypothetical protein
MNDQRVQDIEWERVPDLTPESLQCGNLLNLLPLLEIDILSPSSAEEGRAWDGGPTAVPGWCDLVAQNLLSVSCRKSLWLARNG